MRNKLGLSLLLITLMAACSSPRFEADVVRFHNLAPAANFQGQSVTVIPLDPVQNGLEFATYADVIGRKLATLGFQPAEFQGSADYVAVVDFTIQPVAAVDDRGSSPVSVGVGVGGVGRHVGVSVGTVFGVGDRKPKDIYSRYLSITLKNQASNEVVYEGRVSSNGKEGSPILILPIMTDALFADFPGPSGATTRFETELTPEQP